VILAVFSYPVKAFCLFVSLINCYVICFSNRLTISDLDKGYFSDLDEGYLKRIMDTKSDTIGFFPLLGRYLC
jgi:hypothetical protein